MLVQQGVPELQIKAFCGHGEKTIEAVTESNDTVGYFYAYANKVLDTVLSKQIDIPLHLRGSMRAKKYYGYGRSAASAVE
jgi:hypothetical protein